LRASVECWCSICTINMPQCIKFMNNTVNLGWHFISSVMYVLGLDYWILTKYSLKDAYAAWNYFCGTLCMALSYYDCLDYCCSSYQSPLPACICKASDVAMDPLENSDWSMPLHPVRFRLQVITFLFFHWLYIISREKNMRNLNFGLLYGFCCKCRLKKGELAS
jgi:hypothetical protein